MELRGVKGIPLPSTPRLSGRTALRAWRVKHDEASLEIVPADTPWGLVFFFVLLGAVGLIVPQSLAAMFPSFPDWRIVLGFSGLLAALFVACAIGVLAFYRSEQARGPFMTISFASGDARLPRDGQAWPLSCLVRWDIVIGRHVRPLGRYDRPQAGSCGYQELQLVVEDHGQTIAWPIIGKSGWSDDAFLADCECIARKTNLPIMTVDEADYWGERWRAQEISARRGLSGFLRIIGIGRGSHNAKDHR